MKEYILHPPILVPPRHGKPLLLYLFIIEEDKGNIAFTIHWGTYAYGVMPFGLKNVGATY